MALSKEENAEAKLRSANYTKLSHGATSTILESAPVTMPPQQEKKPVVLKKGMYDDKAHTANPDKYQADSGKGYVSGQPVYDLQLILEDYRYLPKGTANGVYGPKTESMVKAFQTDSVKKHRVQRKTGKMAEISSITYKGEATGEVDSLTQDEIQQWKTQNFLRPVPTLYHNDHDTEAINVLNKPRSGDEYHPIGTPVLAAQQDLQKLSAYSGKLDGWFGDKMKEAVGLFQDAAAKGEFVKADNTRVVLEEKLTGFKRGILDIFTQEYAREVVVKGGKVGPVSNDAVCITDSVGYKGANKPSDVKAVKQRLKELGYPITTVNDICEAEALKAIRFFQIELSDIASKVKSYQSPWFPDGLISKNGATEKSLFDSNAQKYNPPTKGSIKPIASDVQSKIASADKDLKKIWDTLQAKWNAVSIFLPSDSRWTSGYRSAEDQRKLLCNWYNEKYKSKIVSEYGSEEWQKYKDLQEKNNAEADPAMVKMIKGATKQLIAIPGHSAHEKGLAIDIGGSSDVDQVKALLWFRANSNDDAVVTKILPERNGCVHFEFK